MGPLGLSIASLIAVLSFGSGKMTSWSAVLDGVVSGAGLQAKRLNIIAMVADRSIPFLSTYILSLLLVQGLYTNAFLLTNDPLESNILCSPLIMI